MKHSMKLCKLVLCALCVLGAMLPVRAQTTLPTAPVPVASTCVNNGGSSLSNLSVSGSATGFAVAGSSVTTPVAATLADVSFQATCHISAGYETLIVPTVADYNYAMGHYTNQLASFLGKSLTSKLTFDATKVWVDLKFGVGKVIESSANKSAFSTTAGVTVSIPLNSVVTWNTVGVQGVFGHIAGTSGVIITPVGALSNNVSVSSGLSISFGGKH